MNHSLQTELLRSLEGLLPSDSHYLVKNIKKNNGAEHLAVCLSAHGPGAGLSPLVYLEPFFSRLGEGEDPESLARELLGLLRSPVPDGLSAEWFADFSSVKDRIVFRLVNRELNREEIGEIPGRPWLDLYVSYGVSVGEPGGAMAVVKKEMLDLWGIGEEELYLRARENTPALFPARLFRMSEYLAALDPLFREEELPGEELWLLTNGPGFYGAAAVLYSDKVGALAEEQGKDLFLIPSSIHEWVIFTDGERARGISEVIPEVNRSMVEKEEVLSGKLYRYERKSRSFAVCRFSDVF